MKHGLDAGYPKFLRHTGADIVVEAAKGVVVQAGNTKDYREEFPVGYKNDDWNYQYYSPDRLWDSNWKECEDPGIFWVDAIGVVHRKEAT